MLGPLGLAIAALAAWGLTALVLFWGWLPAPGRRLTALLTSAAGVAFLVFAMRSEGVRETPTTVAFLMSPPWVTEQATASASLSYYILTGICLLLGTVGLAVGDESANSLRKHWMGTAVALSLAVTVLRFCLEKVAAHPFLVAVMGVVWLPPVVGAFFSLNLRREGKGVRALASALTAYAFGVRGFVTLCIVIASTLRFGSHYDVSSILEVRTPFTHGAVRFSPGSARQIVDLGVLPQLIFWTAYTLVTGLLGAGVQHAVEGFSGASGPPGELAPAGKDQS
jgi:hypothetical protein